jgi:hypothetical protein
MPVTAVPLVPARGPRGLPLVGNLPAFGRDPLGFLARLRDEFGEAVTWSLGIQRRRGTCARHRREWGRRVHL